MNRPISAQEELERFLDRSAAVFATAFGNLIERSGEAYVSAFHETSTLLRDTLVLADLHGRRRALMEADYHRRRMPKAMKGGAAEEESTPIVPGVPFLEAVDDLLKREPRLAKNYEEVQRMYSKERVFAMTYSASEKLMARVKDAVTNLIAKGETPGMTENEILEIAREEAHDWTRSYAATVYRTNANTAYTNGRFEQARDKDILDVTPAFELVGIVDERERPNHAAARGLIAATGDPIWRRYRPPLGFQCRHGVRLVSRYELERRGLLDRAGNVISYHPPRFSFASPDRGFIPSALEF